MGYLIGEIWLWLLIAFVIGLVIGWLIWGRGRTALQNRITELERQYANAKSRCDACEAEKAELAAAAESFDAERADLKKQVADATAAAQSSSGEVARLTARIAGLEKERDQARAGGGGPGAGSGAGSGAGQGAGRGAGQGAGPGAGPGAGQGAGPGGGPGSGAGAPGVSASSGDVTASPGDTAAGADAGGAGAMAVTEADRPEGLGAPRGAKDDLKLISGVGPKIEGILNDLGIFHFWQIAKWTDREVAWVDDYLSFKGRIDRDKWIDQAKVLASGGETEFSSRNR